LMVGLHPDSGWLLGTLAASVLCVGSKGLASGLYRALLNGACIA